MLQNKNGHLEFRFRHHKTAETQGGQLPRGDTAVIVPTTAETEELLTLWADEAWGTYVGEFCPDQSVEYLFISVMSGTKFEEAHWRLMFMDWQREMGIPEDKIVTPRNLRHMWVTTANGGILPPEAPIPNIDGMAAVSMYCTKCA